MEGSVEFNSETDDLALFHVDEWGFDADEAFPGPLADEGVEGVVVGGTAVGVAGGVLLDCADDDGFRTEDLCPAYGGGEEVSVAEGNVGDWDFGADG